jgi:hypothetical protein
MELLEKTASVATTHRVNEHELLTRLERFCESAGLEFPPEAWPRDDRKAYFLLGLCATEDMRDVSLRERLIHLDSWARKRDLLKPNETLFAKRKPDGSARIKIKAIVDAHATTNRRG